MTPLADDGFDAVTHKCDASLWNKLSDVSVHEHDCEWCPEVRFSKTPSAKGVGGKALVVGSKVKREAAKMRVRIFNISKRICFLV